MTFNITVEREARVKNDKTYFTYFISANIRGKDVRITRWRPSDKHPEQKHPAYRAS